MSTLPETRTFSRAALAAKSLSFSYVKNTIIHDVSVQFPAGKISAIIGPNGCGKSTLLHLLAGLYRPSSGEVSLQGQPLSSFTPKNRAKQLSLLPQTNISPEGITVKGLISRGRYAWQTLFSQWHEEDEKAVNDALLQTGLSDLADREIATLSGGQRQRAWIGLVLAQQTPLILLDEPTTFLDIGHQIDVLNVCEKRNREDGTTIVMVLHDINLAARYAHHIVAMKDGVIVASGAPASVCTSGNMQLLFGIDALVMEDPVHHSPLILPR